MKSQPTTVAVAQDRFICEETIRRIARKDFHLAELMAQVLATIPEGEVQRYVALSRHLAPDILVIYLEALEGVINEASRMQNWGGDRA